MCIRDSLRGAQAVDQRRVLERPVAMIEPLDPQDVERLAHIVGRTFLAGVRHESQSPCLRRAEYPLEFRRRMSKLRGVKTDSSEVIQVRLGAVQGLERVGFRKVTQEAHDQSRTDRERGSGLRERGDDPTNDRTETYAATQVGLRVEEDFRICLLYTSPSP